MVSGPCGRARTAAWLKWQRGRRPCHGQAWCSHMPELQHGASVESRRACPLLQKVRLWGCPMRISCAMGSTRRGGAVMGGRCLVHEHGSRVLAATVRVPALGMRALRANRVPIPGPLRFLARQSRAVPLPFARNHLWSVAMNLGLLGAVHGFPRGGWHERAWRRQPDSSDPADRLLSPTPAAFPR